ncbi:ATP-dependent DNA helicase pif1 [Gigaspora margarita]|uniref:ATP-dependent DNA helicase pif1 n=1 Tax=Gigaspora margarita TaxID=4874 RepID=A0A8H3X330_GIGMA|nr:ATP-dependent DNA helicase pif1 [Gigaspora margarita]
MSISTDQNIKSIANIIINNIKEGDGYAWVVRTAPHISICHKNVGSFYFGCSQSYELARDYKESNRQRMTQFDCHGNLVIRIDIPASRVIVKLKHDILHEKPIDVTTPIEI